jgi:integrase
MSTPLKPIKLTVAGVANATCPAGKPQALYPIDGHSGCYLRVRGTNKTVVTRYRDASGAQRFYRICDATIAPKDIAEAIAIVRGRIAKREDPAGQRKAELKRARARLEPALDAYDKDLERRHVVKRDDVMSLLRRELSRPLGNVDLATVTRNEMVRRIAAVEDSGRPGAAQELRKVAAVFLGWCENHGLIAHSPLAGYRRQRKTRAQRLERPGRALEDWEIKPLWQAAAAAGWPFGPYLQILLLLGQRRTETALMKWADLDLRMGVWTVPAEITKSGRVHKVPLPTAAVTILQDLPRLGRSPLVFPGRDGKAMTGWSKRLPSVYEPTEAAGMPHWTLHDLRRTMRTGLGRLGVDPILSELLLNHAISDELAAIYDRGDYWQKRVQAAAKWANHVVKLVAVRQPAAHHTRKLGVSH